MMRRLLFALGLLSATFAHAQAPDTILVNGNVVRYDAEPAQALAVRGDAIAAIGASADISALAGPGTRVIDLGGRTVIPGLIDSHIHAIRAGLTWQTEVHWIGVRTLAEALGRIRDKAAQAPRGSWLVVAGGWMPRQFAEGRAPTQAEIADAAPEHRIYVQLLYSRVLLSPGGDQALGLAEDGASAAGLAVERDGDGRPTGWLSGDNRAISELFDRLPRPAPAEQIAGTRAFFRALNAVGITGVIDPGGYNLPIEAYQALLQVWRDNALTIRVVYSLCAPRRDHELKDLQALVPPMFFGDQWLRFNGIGENVTWGMYNNDTPSDSQKEQLYQVLRWAAHTPPDCDVPLAEPALGASSPGGAGARQRRGAGRHAALVDRPPERRLPRQPQAHEGHGGRLADAECVLFPRRGVLGPARARACPRVAADRQRA